MNSPIWSAALYSGVAVVLAVDVALPGWLGWVAAVVVLVGDVVVFRQEWRAIDRWYERVDRDAG